VLSPPYSGSTVLEQLLATSPAVTSLPAEGQFVDGVEQWLRDRPWDTSVPRPWPEIRARWEELWDPGLPVRVEKSPPNISRAADLEAHFAPAAFLLLVRDPYATAEGLERRRGHPPMDLVDDTWSRVDALTHAAERWLEFAAYQRDNLDHLGRTHLVTYEQLVADPPAAAAGIVAAFPELERLDAGAEFESHSARGRGTRRLQDFNAEKLARLTPEELAAITAVLRPDADLLTRFGYALRASDDEPDDRRGPLDRLRRRP
jgi:hypothetical protein